MVTKTCPDCGKPFERDATWCASCAAKRNMFYEKRCPDCGKRITDQAERCKSCAKKATAPPPFYRTCDYCGEQFRTVPSKVNKSGLYFCSRECQQNYCMIPCDVCGKMFKPDHPERSESHTCSYKCAGILTSERTKGKILVPPKEYICEFCGKAFSRPERQARKTDGSFCSRKCHQEWSREHATGWVTPGGYRMICVYGREIHEHRYLMEQEIGRPLADDEVVHHINGNKLDNSLDNLKIMTRGDHLQYHLKASRHPDNHETTSVS